MPRQAHGRSLLEAGPAKTRKRKPARERGLNALETAEREFPEKTKIRQHRLGKVEDDDDVPQTRQDVDERSSKRRKIDTTVDDGDTPDEGSDPDGNPWHVGLDEDDEDSDLDSDDAFGESDEERFQDFTFRGSEKPLATTKKLPSKPSKRQVTLDEDDDEDSDLLQDEELEADDDNDDDDLGEDAVDLAAAWDMDDEEQREEQKRARKKKPSKKQPTSFDANSSEESAELSGVGSSADEPEDEYEGFSASEDEGDQHTTARLRSFVDGLTPAQTQVARTQHKILSRSLPDKPSQFALPSAGLSPADLMQYIKDPAQRQSLKILQAGERDDPIAYRTGIPGKLTAPLAKRQQDRLDRVAAYDQGKQTMERWVDTVKQNRRAEHVSFPLVDPAKASASNVKSFQPVSSGLPQSELESKIQEIMRESGYNVGTAEDEEHEERQYEELQERKIPLEEVQARRQELRMQRELMFREEIRAKRIKKIKSKAYRRVHRKEKDKFAVQERERLAAAGILNSDEEREKNDRRRAEERMGARHRESKWAKAAKATGQTIWNDDAKAGVSELARRDDELRRRIQGKTVHGSDESASESDSDFSDSDDENDKWQGRLEELTKTTQPQGKSKLADMAFMKRAEAERKVQNDDELRLLRRSMNGEIDEEPDEDSGADDISARQKFGNSRNKSARSVIPTTPRNEFEEQLSEDEKVHEPTEVPAKSSHQLVAKPVATSSANQKSAHNLSRASQPKQASEAQAADARPLPALRNAWGVPTKEIQTQQSTLNDRPGSSDDEVEGASRLDDKDKLALDIFAGDDEVDLRKQFEKEKRQVVKDEGDQVLDNTLPGWGSWAGAGVSKREQKKGKGRFLSITKGVAPEARRDAKLERVIVNEKRVKKNGKYLATELPHPFESRQQYERSLRLPMGPEWSTRNHFQDSIKPRVLMKQGQVIKPMSKPLA